MRSSAVLAGACSLLLACAALFDDPVQCKTDADCTRFGPAVCGASGTCEQRASGLDGNASQDPGAAGPSGDKGGPGSKSADDPNLPPAESCPDMAARPNVPFPGGTGDGGITADLTGEVALDCKSTYVLTAPVTVQPGATLTIAPGTVIRASDQDAALVVLPGGKLVANGRPDQPIVFTSAAVAPAPGDWRGVMVLGKAPPEGSLQNGAVPYGGNVETDSSGALSYVRIEYANRPLELYSVGRGTKVDGVQIRKSKDNGFTINGGRVDMRHLVAQYAGDEMFEINAGYQGHIQFVIGHRTPTDGANHHGLLVDNATPVIANVTLCGADAPVQGMGLLLRNNAAPTIENAIVTGFAAGFDTVNARGTPFVMTGVTMFGNAPENVAYAEGASQDPQSPEFDDDQGFDERAFFADGASKNGETDPGIAACLTAAVPSFVPQNAINTAIAPDDAFFDKTATYAGAVKDATDNWTKSPWLVWTGN